MPSKTTKKLSQIFGGLKGWPVNSYEGGFPVVQALKNPLALGSSTVHGAITLTTAVQKITSAITNPDFPRALSVTGNQADVLADVVILGRDHAGKTISETITASGLSTIEGNRAFASVQSITVPAKTANGQTVAIGTTKKFGLYRPLCNGSVVDLLTVAGTIENAASVSDDFNTVAPTTAPDGTKTILVYYQTDIF